MLMFKNLDGVSSCVWDKWIQVGTYTTVLDFFSETRDGPGLILHTFLPFYHRRCPSRIERDTHSSKLKNLFLRNEPISY